MAQKSASAHPVTGASHRALYRKYRPTSLADVVGQEQVTTPLQNALKNHKLSHAYLFIGPRGTGKTSVARIFAHAVNDFDYQVEDSYLDIIEIDAASNTGVDNIRELREKAVIAPTKGKYKVYIIDEVHMLTKSASNALLKTLEEPPEHVIFIMATTDAYKVPITISSRTQVHTFKLADPAIMQQHLRKIADAEDLPITDDALAIVTRRGGGSFRDSLSLLDQISSLSDSEITAETINSALGLPQTQSLDNLLNSYASGDRAKIESTLKDLLNTGLKPETIASELISSIIAAPRPELLPLLAKLPDVQPPFPEAKLLLAFLLDSQNTRTAVNITETNTEQPAPKSDFRTKLAERIAQKKSPTKIPPTTPPAKIAPTAPPAAPSVTPPSVSPVTPPATSPEIPAAPATPAQPQSAAKQSVISPDQPFAWDNFLDQVHSQNDAVYVQLQKVDYEFDGQTLHLYPQQKFTKSVLEKSANTKIILKCAGVGISIHELGEKQSPKDATLSQISAIMGDVREITGDMPF